MTPNSILLIAILGSAGLTKIFDVPIVKVIVLLAEQAAALGRRSNIMRTFRQSWILRQATKAPGSSDTLDIFTPMDGNFQHS